MKLQKVNILLPIAYAYREQIVEVAKVDSNFSVVDNCIKQSIYIPHRFFSEDLRGQNLSPLDGVTVTIGINLDKYIHIMDVRSFSKVEPLLKSLGVDLNLLLLSEFAEFANSDYRNTLTRYFDERRLSYINDGSIFYRAEGFSEYDICDNCRVWYSKYTSEEEELKAFDHIAKVFFKKFKSCTKVMFWREVSFNEQNEELFPKRVPDVIVYRNI